MIITRDPFGVDYRLQRWNLFRFNDFRTPMLTGRGRAADRIHRGKLDFSAGRLAAVLGAAGIACFCGCAANAPEAPANDPGTASASVATGGAPAPANGETPRRTALVHDSRTRWIGDIPYDVWFDRPLDVYRDSTPLVATTGDAGSVPMAVAPDNKTTAPEATPAADPPAVDAAAGVDWNEIAPAEVLIAETKDIRVRLTANLQTVAAFNKSWMAVANDGALLSALAGVVERTPAEVNWKDKSSHIRELAYQIYSVDATGREQFEKAKAPFDQITAMLDGGPPPDGDVAREAPFADYVSRGEMMKRIDTSFTWLKSDVNTPTRLKEDAEKAVHEATVLRMLGTIFGDASYEFSEEPEFQEFVRSFVEGNAAVVQAVRTGNFAEFEAARNRIQSTCDPCHQKYRNAGN